MSKTAKKLFSVVLAVLVLAAGFSTTLGAFKPVSAEEVEDIDYTKLVEDITKNSNIGNADGERGLLPEHPSEIDPNNKINSNYYVVAPDNFKIYDVMGFGTNLDDANKRSGLRVENYFFQHNDPNRVYSVGADRKDIHPYITYEVGSGASFTVEYLTYDEGSWAGQGLGDRAKELMYLNILVSSDGLNFIPAKVENTVVDTGAYYHVKAHIKNVGANTRYVKVMSLVDPTTVTTTHVPQEALIIQKVSFNKATTEAAAVAEVNLEFANNEVLKNGEKVSKVSDVFRAGSSPDVNFGGICGITTTGYLYESGGDGWQDKYAWGSISEQKRSLYLNVQPGTRFQLKWSSYNNWTDTAYALMAYNKAYNDKVEGYTDVYAEYETVEDFAWKVYTSDCTQGEWTEHKMVPHVGKTGTMNVMSYDFIIPEGHCFVKLVDPVAGSIGCIMQTGENGLPKAADKGNAVSNSAGNDWAQLNSISYTPTVVNAEITKHTYAASTTNITATSHASLPTEFLRATGAVAAGNGVRYEDTWITSSPNLGGIILDGYSNGRGYLIYRVQPGTVFEAETWINPGHIAKFTNAQQGIFQFIFSGSSTLDGAYSTLTNTATDANTPNQLEVTAFVVPDDVNYIKVEFPATINSADGAYANHSASLHWVSYVAHPDTSAEVTYEYNDLSQYPYGTDYDKYTGDNGSIYVDPNATPKVAWKYYEGTKTYAKIAYAPVSTGNANLLPLTSIVKSYNITLDNHQGNKLGITMAWKKYNGNSGTETTRPYVIYQVQPGTTFRANVFVNNGVKDTAENTDQKGATNKKLFEFFVSASDKLDGTYQPICNTSTTSAKTNHTISAEVPEECSYVKVEFPQTGNVGGNVQNHAARLLDVTYVPVDRTFNYKVTPYTSMSSVGKTNNISDKRFAASTAVNSNSKAELFKAATGAVDAHRLWLDNWNYNGLGLFVDQTGFTTGIDTRERSYITYKVQPGTQFTITTNGNPTTAHAKLHGDDAATKFRMFVSASDKIDSGYEVIDSLIDKNSLTVNVPENCKYVKVEFPQTGVTASCSVGNHCVFLTNVSYTAYYEKVTTEEVVDPELNNYAKGDANLDHESKVAYEIYDFEGVKGTANGLTSENGGYVIYKVSNDQALVIKTAYTLDFEVSYGDEYVDAQLYKANGAYTVNVVEGKQYVKVNLDAGETITAVKAAALAPTATFTNAAGQVEVIELDSYGVKPVPTINTARAGYTFTQWNDTVGPLWLDAEYEAVYEKNESDKDFFTVDLDETSKALGAKITYAGGRTATTVRFDDRVTIEAPATSDTISDVVFDKWVDANDESRVISNSHKFSFLASESITLKAIYSDSGKTTDGAFIYNNANAIVTSNEGETKWNMSVVWRVNAPAGAKVTETGILFSTGDLAEDAACKAVIDGGVNPAIVKFEHSNPAAGKSLMFTVTGIREGAKRYARPYAIVDDKPVFGSVVVVDDAE